ncbi:MAG: hypothetical protein QXI84_08335 [Thermofilaceae archaeon]
MATWLVGLTSDEHDIYQLNQLKLELLHYLIASGAEDVEEIKRLIGEFLRRPDVVAKLRTKDLEKVYAANVESLDEHVGALFENLEFVKREEAVVDALLSLLTIYKILTRHPELRPSYLLDAVACEYLLHVAVRRQREDLVKKASKAIKELAQRLVAHLTELEAEW